MLSTDPGNLFGYERFAFDADVRYDKHSSHESGVDANTGGEAPGSSTTSLKAQSKGPVEKPVTKVATTVTPGLLVAAARTSFAKPTAHGMVPGISRRLRLR